MVFLGGQFKSATHGQFKSAQGGQFDRILQVNHPLERIMQHVDLLCTVGKHFRQLKPKPDR